MYSFARLKILKNIFILIFFSGMLYTVFNYVPIIEEEVSTKKHEQTSQAKNADGGTGDAEDEGGDTLEDLVNSSGRIGLNLSQYENIFRQYINRCYLTPRPERCTPPPRPIA